MAEKVYWSGRLNACDVCGGSFNKRMYDCVTRQGPWGNLCHGCWCVHGRPLGLGRGQKYELQKDGRWLKVDG
jgi:hypothetical protein